MLAGVVVVATAVVHVGWWQQRYVAPFDAAVVDARAAAAETADAFAALGEARVDAGPVLDRSAAFADAGAGYLGAAELESLHSTIDEFRSDSAQDVSPLPPPPPFSRPALVDLERATHDVVQWTSASEGHTDAVTAMVTQLAHDGTELDLAVQVVLATTVGVATAELGAAPLATPDARAAVERTRDALAHAATDADLAALTKAFTSAIVQLRASQQAEAAAQQSSGGESRYDNLDAIRDELFDAYCSSLGYMIPECA